MTRVEREHIRDGEVALVASPRSDLKVELDADGRVLAVERTGDDVRYRDLIDVLAETVYAHPPAEEDPTCDGCATVDYYLTVVVIEVNEGEEMGGRDEYELCNDCLIKRAPALVAAGSTAELVTGEEPAERTDP